MPSPTPLVEVRHLQVRFPLEDGAGAVHAVQDVSFSIPAGRTVGLVGESGSGKTMTGLSLLRLVPAPGAVAGEIWYRGRDGESAVNLAALDPDSEAIRRIRGREIA